MIKQGLKPILDKNTKILILGSLPSDVSIEKQQYYAKPSNDFWKILSEVLNNNFKVDYENKLELLKKHNIGLWDVFHQCTRKGSLDSNIKDEVLNDFTNLKTTCPDLKLICLNGKKAGEHKKIFDNLGINTIILPSSSGTNRKINRPLSWSILSSKKVFVQGMQTLFFPSQNFPLS